MGDASAAARTQLGDVPTVVDADGHIQESLEDFLPYMDEQYGTIRQFIERSAAPLSEVYSVVTPTPPFRWKGQDVNLREDNTGTAILGDASPTEELFTLRKELEIDACVLNPTLNLLLSSISNGRVAYAIANAYNSWLVAQLDDMAGFTGNLLIAGRKPSKAAEEIDDRAGEDHIVGIQLLAQGRIPPPGHEWYDPIYEAAEASGLPVCMHSVPGYPSFPQLSYWNETYALDHYIQHPIQHMWNLGSMLFEGVPERFPDLQFVYQEAGLGYIPYAINRLDDHYLEMGYEIPALTKLPSKYIRDQFFFTTQPLGHPSSRTNYISNVIREIGVDSVLFSADIPHADFDTPAELFDRVAMDLSTDELGRLMGQNAVEVFDL